MLCFNIKIITSNNFGGLQLVDLKYFLATDKNTQKVFPINTKYLSRQNPLKTQAFQQYKIQTDMR